MNRQHRVARTVALIPGVFACVGLLVGCGNGGDQNLPAPGSTVEEGSPDDTAPGVREVAPGRFEVRMQATEAGFNPTEVRVPVGAHVAFLVTSTDVPHGLLIEGTDVEIDVFPMSTAEAEYVFEEPGEYRFMCHVYCGGGHDMMTGRIVVE